MSSRLDPGRCQDELVWVDIESSKLGRCRAVRPVSMSSRTGQANVELSKPGPMSSRTGPRGRAHIDVEPNGPGPMSSLSRAGADVEWSEPE